MLLLAFILLPVGLTLLIVGLHGRIIGKDPHCRKCGFNLRGRDPATTRCSECGAELNDAAIRIGLRRRGPALISIGLLLLLASLAGIGVGGWQAARDYDWTPWKISAWLLDDLDSTDPVVKRRSLNELIARVQSASYPQKRIDTISDRVLKRQADLTQRWDDAFGAVIERAAAANHVDAKRMERYVRQMATATLTIKPKLRRTGYLTLQLNIRFDRKDGYNDTLRGSWGTTPLMIDGEALTQREWASQRDDHVLGGGTSYTTSQSPKWQELAKLPDGKHQVTAKVEMTMSLKSPAGVGPIKFDLPLSMPVELFAADAAVDEFKVDESLRDAMQKSIEAARVTHDPNGMVDIRLKLNSPRMPLSMDVVLAQGKAEQKVGPLLFTSGHRWHRVYGFVKPQFAGAVDVHLRPSESPADTETVLRRYWGEELVILGVVVDAPYTPPFVHDDSLRPAVEKALTTVPPKISRLREGLLNVNVNAYQSPVKLGYVVLLRSGDRQVRLSDMAFLVSPNQNQGWGTTSRDLGADVTKCDVIFRPDSNWEATSQDLNPPWDGEVVIHDVRIESGK